MYVFPRRFPLSMSDVVELGLRRKTEPQPPSPAAPGQPASGGSLKGLSEAFLKLVVDFAPDSPASAAFRELAEELEL